jgi:tripartite-type tricarboxylate transporter receptor subunit TctC
MIRKETEMRASRLIGLVCGLVFLAFLGGALGQEKYPNRPIEVVVPMGPGGSADIGARIYAEQLAKELKVPVTVVNRAGGTGIQGSTYVKRARPDGYTLLGTTYTGLTISPVLSEEETYDSLKDFIPLGHFASTPNVFDVKIDSPFQTLSQLVEYARKNPGKLKSGCGGGIGTEGYFNLQILCANNGIKIVAIPFKSGGEGLPALLGGHVDMLSQTLATDGPHIKAGKFRCLAITSKKRHPDFPDIPTTAELGYPYANFEVMMGLLAPAGVPQAVLNVLIPAAERAFKNPEVIQRGTQAMLTVEYMNPEEQHKFLASQIQIVKKVALDANLMKK